MAGSRRCVCAIVEAEGSASEVSVIRIKLNRRKAALFVVVALIAVAVVGALLTSGGADRSPSGKGGGTAGVGTAPDGMNAGSADASGSTISTSSIIGRDRVGQTVAQNDAARASVPATDGAVLATVSVPPPSTLAMIETQRATAGSEYSVVFRVYGFGPTSGTITTAVVLISSSTPVGQVAKPFAFKGRNVLVRLDPVAAAALDRGGSYRGVIKLRLTGDALIPWLGDVGSVS